VNNETLSPVRNKRLKRLIGDYNSVAIVLVLLILATFVVDGFNGKSISTILVQASIYGFIALGLSLVMITGNIDLSVGYQLSSAGIVCILVLNATGSMFVAVIAALLCGALTGAINGTIVTKIGVNPLIATIATNYIYKGFTYYFTKDGSYTPAKDYKSNLKFLAKCQLFDAKWLSLTIIIFVVVLALMFFIMRKTKFGNSLYISGDNAEAGQFAGINIGRTNLLAFVLCGVFCALAGILFTSDNAGLTYTLGEGKDVFAISACVIGGIKMAGGKGTMVNVLSGVLVMRIISKCLDMMLLPQQWSNFVSGALLIVILLVDSLSSRKKA
jgi:ribose transport system permease protein